MTNPPTNPLQVHLVREVPAPQKAVFEAWLDPERLAIFLKPARGVKVLEQKLDPRLGGRFELVFLLGETRIPIHGEYKRMDRHSALAFSWLAAHNIPTSLVTLTFEATAPDRTRVTLLHTGFPDEEEVSRHNHGWGLVLEGLEAMFAK